MFDRFKVLTTHYKERINKWDWEEFKNRALSNCAADFEGNVIASHYLGSVMSLAPSGKFYSMWCTNQTRSDVTRDSCFFDALEEVAAEHGMFVSAGEGDPTDLFLQSIVEDLSEVRAFVTEEDEELAKELLEDKEVSDMGN